MNDTRENLGGSELPTPYGPFLESISFIAMDVIQWLPLNCAYDKGFTSWDALLATTLIPIVTFAVIVVVVVALELQKRARGFLPRPYSRVLAGPLYYAMLAMLFIVPTISQRVCNSFRCTSYDAGDGLEESLLAIDLRVNCSSGQYQLLTAYGLLMIFGE